MVDIDFPEQCAALTHPDVRLGVAVRFEVGMGADSVSMAQIAARSLSGRYRAQAALTIPGPVPPALLVPPGMHVTRSTWNVRSRVVLAESHDAAVLVRGSERLTTVDMYADEDRALAALWKAVGHLAEMHLSVGSGDVAVGQWRYSGGFPQVSDDYVAVEPWSEVRRNYPNSAARALDKLMGLRSPPNRGRLLLWHGPPGTGKTSAVASLMSEWVGWCDSHLITDPERLFGEPDYLDAVLHHSAQPDLAAELPNMKGRRATRWKLIVCEDADEYLRIDARQRSGPALGRLLNATDGIVARNSQALILLTTNDDIGRLHPALTRPGRCLSAEHFPAMNRSEAAAWCPPGVNPPPGGATLAELYGVAAGTVSTVDTDDTVGNYL